MTDTAMATSGAPNWAMIFLLICRCQNRWDRVSRPGLPGIDRIRQRLQRISPPPTITMEGHSTPEFHLATDRRFVVPRPGGLCLPRARAAEEASRPGHPARPRALCELPH